MKMKPEPVADRISRLEPDSAVCYPNSQKVYVQGSRADLQVPMREISLTATVTATGTEKNPPLRVYDTSGPYSDQTATIDLQRGLPPLREAWIAQRNDSERLPQASSRYGLLRQQDATTAHLRFRHTRLPRRARSGCNVTQLHYARRGIVTPEMEFVAIRENLARAQPAAAMQATATTSG